MSLKLQTPSEFPAFPFKPYDIQLDLMRHLYASVEDRKITIVESPTGTGKTLSLLCSSLTWLKDEQERARKGKLSELGESHEGPDWVLAQTLDRRRTPGEGTQKGGRDAEACTCTGAKETGESTLRRNYRKSLPTRVPRMTTTASFCRKMMGQTPTLTMKRAIYPPQKVDRVVTEEAPRLRQGTKPSTPGSDAEEEPGCTKIYYASRTHTQLAQVLHELRKLKLMLSVTLASAPEEAAAVSGKRRLPEVENDDDDLGSSYASMSQSRSRTPEKRKKRCHYLPPPEDESKMLDLRDQILASPKDIEDLVATGQDSETCPYFGSRRAIRQAQLVLLPYNLLLQKTAREALGIDLTDQVQTDKQHTQGPKSGNEKARGAGVEVMTPGELLHRLGRKTEGVNLLEVETYLRGSKIARKVSGYSVKTLERAAGHDPVKLAKVSRLSNTTPPLHLVESFITALTASNDDGRVTLSLVDGQVEIKYQHLNPSTHFRELIDIARSIVLAGGTMSPVSDVIHQLFMGLEPSRIRTFSCGHIIPTSNLQTLVLKKGPRGGDLLFKYEQRGNQAIIAELGQILLNFVNVVPKGMVVFLPSYSFLHTMMSAWEGSGLMEKLKSRKRVFSEPQDAGQIEAVLREYSEAIHRTGALLFAVVGAKLSEGLNFTDDLARAVLIIGLPFANLASPELRERMSYVNRLEQQLRAKGDAVTKGASATKDAATELYENMCMNAVNQSIGRAIRHRGDWASLILIDGRYASSRIRNKLPKWIGGNTTVTETFGQAMREMGKFFREKKVAAS
ncbi:hypothetical protein IEO21_03872 [Rhodonia placenta]|uniref:ATP-dependent DNA helicase CHL1 n=1 Tax=Rhodonia placenta TaxID=104341 RepID=A0A8H7U329_9APHY|nr:hypothetical protein IEO21_03872 [Postia placenta]